MGKFERYIETTEQFLNLIPEILKIKPAFTLTVKPVKILKSKRQLGFLWACLFSEIVQWYNELEARKEGFLLNTDDIKQMFYAEFGISEPDQYPNGVPFMRAVKPTLSKMSHGEASNFIENILNFCDVEQIRLTPPARYMWLKYVNENEVEFIDVSKFNKEDHDFLRYIRKQPCLQCGKYDRIEAHHLTGAGMGQKNPDWQTIPLCREHHDKVQRYEIEATAPHGYSILEFCKLNFWKWLNHC